MALLIPLALAWDCLVKNDTVKGIIGNTHGVNKANKPPINPNKKMVNKPSFCCFPSASCSKSPLFFNGSINCSESSLLFSSSLTSAVTIAFPSKEKLKSSSIWIQTSLHTCAKKVNVTLVISVLVSCIRWVIMAFSLKKISSFSHTSLYSL